MPNASATRTDAALLAFERGNAAFDRGEWATAEAEYREALARKPDYTLARYNYGLLLLTLSRGVDSERELRLVLATDTQFSQARANLGSALGLQRRFAEADEQFRVAAAHGDAAPELSLNWSSALTELGRFREAATLLKPLAPVPEYRVDALTQLALVRLLEGNPEEAVELYRELQRLGVNSAAVRSNLGAALLAAGRWAEGWAEYEARLELNPLRPSVACPSWNGEPLAGRSILLRSEQGLGDLIQFVRFAGMLADRGATVSLECPPEAEELLATHRGIARIVRPPLPEFDYQLPLLSVPRVLGITRDTVPACVPYLHANESKHAFWRTRLPQPDTFRVGVVWRGGDAFLRNRWRSINLEELAPLFGVKGATFISLQRGSGLDELAHYGLTLGLHDLGPAYQTGTLADTAAIISELDLVISVDTSVAHLTGALGRRGWVAISEPPSDWRWERGVSTSRWYPTIHLFRQQAFGQWEPVVEELRQTLECHIRGQIGRSTPQTKRV